MRNLRILSIVAIVAMLSSVSIALPPTPWGAAGQILIPVVMDIVPVASLSLNGAVIKLAPTVGGDVGDFSGCANPQPILQSNVSVTVLAEVEPVAPLVTNDANCYVALQGQPWDFTSAQDYDPAYIGSGVHIPVCVLFRQVNMAARPEGLDERVGTVILTVTP
jgi:hypothetical protein